MLVVEGAVVVTAEATMLSGVLRGDFVGVAEVEESEGLFRDEVELGEFERHRSSLSTLAAFIAIGCSL